MDFYKKLTNLFKYNTYVKRKIRTARILAPVPNYEALEDPGGAFFRITDDLISSYMRNIQSIGQMNRLARYADYNEMDVYPEIGAALDIYTEECITPNEDGDFFIIESKDKRISDILHELFFDILNFKINLPVWLRTTLKYGDQYLFLNLARDSIIDALPLPVNEIERIDELEDGRFIVSYRWLSTNTILQNFQVVNFRLLSKEIYFPYGTSVIENARRIWRQLTLVEDMMLSYRMIRSSERRVIYIDVGNIAPDKIPAFINKVKAQLKQNKITDPKTGRNDLRYDPYDVETDFYIPVRGAKTGTRIETLPAGSNVTAIDDVKYLQSKLFAALKIPKSYLGYEEDINAKNTLIQEDIRFARTISRIQRQFIADCNKLAIIQLYLKGVPEDKLLNFELSLPLSSTAYELQKLNLWSLRTNVINSLQSDKFPVEWVLREIINISEKKYKKYIDYISKNKEKSGEMKKAEEVAPTEVLEPTEEETPETGEGEYYEIEKSEADSSYMKKFDYATDIKNIFSNRYVDKTKKLNNDELLDGLDENNIKRFLAEYVNDKSKAEMAAKAINVMNVTSAAPSKKQMLDQIVNDFKKNKSN